MKNHSRMWMLTVVGDLDKEQENTLTLKFDMDEVVDNVHKCEKIQAIPPWKLGSANVHRVTKTLESQ